MMLRMLGADLLKLRRKMVWLLVFLGPLGVVGLEAANFFIRYDYLTKRYAANLWQGLIGETQSLSAAALLLGIAILTSMTAGIEHQMNAWKQLLALPIPRRSVFAAKFVVQVLLLTISCATLAIGTIGLGLALGFGWEFELQLILKACFYPFIAALPILALQLWMAITLRNQAIPLMVGIVGTALLLFAFKIPDWLPWKWPLLVNEAGKPEYSVLAGAGTGLVLLLLGVIDFSRRDVK